MEAQHGTNIVDYEKIGKRIRSQRKEKGLSQEKLADQLGISLSFWLQAPVDDMLECYSYWESILWYLNECDLDENYKRVNKKWFK